MPTDLKPLIDWPKFWAVMKVDDRIWIGVGPANHNFVSSRAGWRQLEDWGDKKSRKSPDSAIPANVGGAFWRLREDVDFDMQAQDRMQRLLGDGREFFSLEDGQDRMGNLPASGTAVQAVIWRLGKVEAITYPMAEPGSQEFHEEIPGEIPGRSRYHRFLGQLAFFATRQDAIADVVAGLPDAMRPLPSTEAISPAPLRAEVSASGWTGQISFISPEPAVSELERRLLLTSLGVAEAPPRNAAVTSTIRFPLSEWAEWRAWLNVTGVDWTPISGFNPDAPWEGDVDEAALAVLPGWERPGPNGSTLLPAQKDGVRFFLQRRGRALLADEMGVGKTVQAITAASALHAGRTLVVAPAGVKSVWSRELLGWGVATKDAIHILSGTGDRPGPDDRWLICNYEQIAIKNELFSCENQQEFDIVKALLMEHGVIDGREVVDDKKVDATGTAGAGRGVRKKYRIAIKVKADDMESATIPDAAAQAVADVLFEKRRATWWRLVARINGESLAALLDWQPGVVIFDEAHRLKNGAANRTKSAIRLSREAITGCFLLSGTPIVNNTGEPATLLHVMDPGAYQELRDYRVSIERIRGLMAPVTLRRLLKDVGHDLPPRTDQIIDFDGHAAIGTGADDMIQGYSILDAIRKTGESVIQSFWDEDVPRPVWGGGDTDRNQIIKKAWHLGLRQAGRHCPIENHTGVTLASMLRPRLSLAKAKSAQALDIIENVLENQGCVVVFTIYKDGKAHLMEQLGKRWRVGEVSGDVPPGPKRDAVVNDFQTGKIDCLVVSLKAGGEGIDLWRASTCVMLDIPETAKEVDQGVGRLRRPGQKSDHVQVIYCVSDNPIDRFLIDLCKEKADRTGKVLGETFQIMGTLQGDLECRGLSPANNNNADNNAPVDKDKEESGNHPMSQKARRGHGVITKTFSDENVTGNRKHLRQLSAEDRLRKLADRQEQAEDRLMEALDRQRRWNEKDVTDDEETLPDAAQTPGAVEVTEHREETDREETVTDCEPKKTDALDLLSISHETEVTDARELEETEPREEQVTDGETEVMDITGGPTTVNKKRRAAQWESQHPEKVKQQTAARAKRYRERHPEKHKEGLKAYRQEHKAEIRAYMREYRKDNEDMKAKHREYMRAWRARQKASA